MDFPLPDSPAAQMFRPDGWQVTARPQRVPVAGRYAAAPEIRYFEQRCHVREVFLSEGNVPVVSAMACSSV